MFTRNEETIMVTVGGVSVATSCVAAATARLIASATTGLFRIPSGVSSEYSIGRLREGNSLPDWSHVRVIVSTDSNIIPVSFFKSVVMVETAR